jgi:hypothetical protein
MTGSRAKAGCGETGGVDEDDAADEGGRVPYEADGGADILIPQESHQSSAADSWPLGQSIVPTPHPPRGADPQVVREAAA